MDMNRKLAHLHTPIGINTIKTITQRQYKTHTTTPTHMYAQQKKLIVYRYTHNKKNAIEHWQHQIETHIQTYSHVCHTQWKSWILRKTHLFTENCHTCGGLFF